jgi:hypothetical protein
MALLCHEDQNFLTFFAEGSRHMKPISASLALHGAEWAGQRFFQMQIIGMIQREDLTD